MLFTTTFRVSFRCGNPPGIKLSFFLEPLGTVGEAVDGAVDGAVADFTEPDFGPKMDGNGAQGASKPDLDNWEVFGDEDGLVVLLESDDDLTSTQ